MPTIDLGAARPAGTGLLDALPRRLTLTLPELRFVADRAGGAPLPFEVADAPPGTGLGERLGSTPAVTDAEARAAALARLHEPQASLARRGLLVDTVLDEGLLGAVGLLATPEVALDLDVTAGGARALAWHRQAGGAVATLATVDGLVFELAWLPVDRWPEELARVAMVPEDLTTGDTAVPERLDLPFQLLDAASEALRSHRADLLSVLVAEHGADLDLVPVLTALAAETRGRLRALVADVSGADATVVGVLSWVLLADGWRALRPYGADRVEVRRVQPGDLAAELAPVLAEVRP
ncbi:hypothetical protein GCM10027062_03560 [Nocardioides hungaricus]